MILTDKTKIEFEKWFNNNKSLESIIDLYIEVEIDYGLTDYKYLKFEDIPFSLQYGVMVDFFDDNSIEVRANSQTDGSGFKYYESFTNGYLGAWYSRPEARTEAIKKANEIFNSK